MKNTPFTKEIIARFFQNTLDEMQHQQVLDWLGTCTKEEQDVFLDAHLDYLEQQISEPAKNTSSGFEDLKASILKRERVKKNFSTWSVRIAAALFPFLLLWMLFPQPKAELQELPSAIQVSAVKIIDFHNDGKQNKEITLPDSSIVTLYPGASVQYAAHFVQQKRELKLNGKAFFKVKHDVQHPFIVHSGAVQTVVLGTSFWVDAGRPTGNVRVKVKTGKVGVKGEHTATVFLLPREEAVFIQNTGTLTKNTPQKETKNTAASQSIPGTTSALAFNETPLQQVLVALEEQFHLSIQLEDETLARLQITMSTKGKSLEIILDEIKAKTGMQYEIKGQKVVFKSYP
ncbi:FecR family protein [Pedobacter caeni]|uniref:FecR family protein n=1 Tax=Pedobacter caeni TaxID=288992 RepID=A0A1M4VV54_9SPHI|nr:FecR domain-containing protein [Pedobacter caeni]SHE72817.1 FecR family protein [Pedobacter caeni]